MKKIILVLISILFFNILSFTQLTISTVVTNANPTTLSISGDTVELMLTTELLFSGSPIDTVAQVVYRIRTDTMESLGTPFRTVFGSSTFVGGILMDTVDFEYFPGEVRTGPINVIIIWPSLVEPSVGLDSIVEQVYFPFNVSIPLEEDALNFEVFPNPSNSIVLVSIHSSIGEVCCAELYNASGVCIAKYGNEINQISLSEFDSGVYILRVIASNNRVYHRKIIKY